MKTKVTAKKKEPNPRYDLETWFREQFGRRPSNEFTQDLFKKYMEKKKQMDEALNLLNACDVYDARWNAVMNTYAYVKFSDAVVKNRAKVNKKR